MIVSIKNFEDLEDKEEWVNILAVIKSHLNNLMCDIYTVYSELKLNRSIWERILNRTKEIDGIHVSELGWEQVRDKLIPSINKGIKELEKNKKVFRGNWTLSGLEKILKVAETCVKYKRAIKIYPY